MGQFAHQVIGCIVAFARLPPTCPVRANVGGVFLASRTFLKPIALNQVHFVSFRRVVWQGISRSAMRCIGQVM
ncbi:hypothetical protein CSC3H3_16675 [Thalassospira marina]|uniref:Secreted protein n=1 Tax=Thalassospira marina TaxID=2048283 RepID=A0ABM6QC79_9PROT|nr:hypothetical protein CSC3H3_16675 [Thalassospira marina]